jgi:hypothetical protein
MHIRSKLGVLAIIAFVLAAPITLLVSNLAGIDQEVVIHFSLATGFALLAFAVFDFRMARWITWVGCLSMVVLAAIFVMQGVSKAVDSKWLDDLAFDVLGQEVESGLVNIFALWCLGVLVFISRGKTRTFGIVALSLVVLVEAYRYGLLIAGDEAVGILKLLFILLVVWFLLESLRKLPLEPKHEVAAHQPIG